MFGPRLKDRGFGPQAAFGAVKTGRLLQKESPRPSRFGPARCGPRISIYCSDVTYTFSSPGYFPAVRCAGNKRPFVSRALSWWFRKQHQGVCPPRAERASAACADGGKGVVSGEVVQGPLGLRPSQNAQRMGDVKAKVEAAFLQKARSRPEPRCGRRWPPARRGYNGHRGPRSAPAATSPGAAAPPACP